MIETITLVSDQKVLAEVETFCQAFSDKYQLSEDMLDSILIAITELVNNAIIHGNKNDITKKVIVRLIKEDGKLIIEVMDEGKGFDENVISDPTSEENLYKTSGRGIFIVKHMSKSFKHFSRENHHVAQLVFELSS